MNENEALAKKVLESKGWTVLRRGVPDFFCHRRDRDGRMEFMAIEVKVPPDHLSPDQEKWRQFWVALGFRYEVVDPTTAPRTYLEDLMRASEEDSWRPLNQSKHSPYASIGELRDARMEKSERARKLRNKAILPPRRVRLRRARASLGPAAGGHTEGFVKASEYQDSKKEA